MENNKLKDISNNISNSRVGPANSLNSLKMNLNIEQDHAGIDKENTDPRTGTKNSFNLSKLIKNNEKIGEHSEKIVENSETLDQNEAQDLMSMVSDTSSDGFEVRNF